jgi:sigma-B regulation protein RsbQ
VSEQGDGPVTLLFVHGLGCHQGIWRRVMPAFAASHRVVALDLAGCGGADPSRCHRVLEGHADDLIAVAERLRDRRLVLVVHSVGCMVGLLADLKAPHLFDAHAMVAPSPCYLNLPDWQGGFEPAQMTQMLQALELDVRSFMHGLAERLLPPGRPELVQELRDAFDLADPDALAQFARATFSGDFRDRLPGLVKPVLLQQCADDPVAPQSVGLGMQRLLPDARLDLLPVAGHMPHMSHPQLCIASLERFLASLGFLAPLR